MASSAVDVAMKGLEAIGIALPPSMEGLIEMLVNEGEDVLTAIPRVITIIEQLGGNTWHILDEVASGMQQYGPAGYVQHQVDLTFDPHITRVQDIHQSKQALMALHRDALATLKTRVNTLAPGGSSTQQHTYTGAAADTMLLSFDAISAEMTAHVDLLEQSMLIDRQFLTNIQMVKTVSADTAIITLIIIGAALVIALALVAFTGGLSLAVAGVGIVTILSAADAALLAAIIAAFVAWGIQHELLAHPIQLNWGPSTLSPTTPSPITGPAHATSTNGSQIIIHLAGDLPKNNIVNTTNKNKRKYIPPRNSGGHVTRDPHGDGFIDDKGNIWVWAEDPHGGPHWDVQHPKSKKHTNVAPDGTIIGADNFPNSDSVVPPQVQPKK